MKDEFENLKMRTNVEMWKCGNVEMKEQFENERMRECGDVEMWNEKTNLEMSGFENLKMNATFKDAHDV